MIKENINFLIYSFLISIFIVFIISKNFVKKNKFIDNLLYITLLTFIFYILFTKFFYKQENFTSEESEEEMMKTEEETTMMTEEETTMMTEEETTMMTEEEMMKTEEENYVDKKHIITKEESKLRPNLFEKTMETDNYVKGPININVSYKSAINDSNIAKDDISVISRNKLNSERQFDNQNETPSYPPSPPPSQYGITNNNNNNNNNNNVWSNTYSPPPPKIYVPPTESSYNPNVVKVPQKRVIIPPVAGTDYKGKKEPCPVMINKPWSDYLSGDYK